MTLVRSPARCLMSVPRLSPLSNRCRISPQLEGASSHWSRWTWICLSERLPSPLVISLPLYTRLHDCGGGIKNTISSKCGLYRFGYFP
ncbi:FK506 suppressor Sfk1 [Histoplasma capsulatum var. duboisii H88]|uniref:FK506 suppressor Sfk1 n=1 Tax=Ajellomyces capsulatus (strain H88) TaxID=544711 RepID=A0A8A1L8J0_AJEC8|nr:FK506 suppressor Sfk1 [Histoplasma capsulatum var. duboisii H88]